MPESSYVSEKWFMFTMGILHAFCLPILGENTMADPTLSVGVKTPTRKELGSAEKSQHGGWRAKETKNVVKRGQVWPGLEELREQ